MTTESKAQETTGNTAKEKGETSTDGQKTGQVKEWLPPYLDQARTAMGHLKAVLPHQFFPGKPAASFLVGYREVYPFELHLKCATCMRSGMRVQWLKPFSFGLHLTPTPRKKSVVTTMPDTPIPFHPQFRDHIVLGKRYGQWKDPLEPFKSEPLTDLLLRLILTHVFWIDQMNPQGYLPANRKAWQWYKENLGSFPTEIPAFELQKFEKFGRPDWVPEKMEKAAEETQTQTVEKPTNQTICSKPKPLIQAEDHYQVKEVDWPHQLAVDRKSEPWPTLCEQTLRVYLTGRAFKTLRDSSFAHLGAGGNLCIAGSIRGHVFAKKDLGSVAWATQIRTRPVPVGLQAQSLQTVLNDQYASMMSTLSREEILLGWFVAYAGVNQGQIHDLLIDLHGRNFKKDWQVLVICDRGKDNWWAFKGKDLEPIRGGVFRDFDPPLPNHKKKKRTLFSWRH